MKGLFDQGRTLNVGNFYTSYELAESFFQKDTHVVETVRVAKKHFPRKVMNATLRRGDVVAK